ncbi:hypothetical protein EAS64_32570 [Trebonia kvetii]|uniref:Uncharacterized protein n=1 Tax=Trebonia kvetii TaxID=2480626 RepID=A0A6P2BSB8_9ACTN|nr:hypothetical protein [Trebonia kvetii]TVZ01045.1 hypothetical protein EAS64_32570 [Trebonia kvetii]
MVTADELLAGPRGRLLCWAVLQVGLADDLRDLPAWPRAWEGLNGGDLSGRVDALASIVARTDLASLAASSGTVLEALGWTVDAAGYWGQPGPEDRALASDAAAEALRPVAAALAASPASRWWDTPVDLARQRYAQYLDNRPFDEPMLSGAAGRVAAWVTDTASRESALRGEPEEPLGAWSGEWWSDPALSGLPVTTRALPGLGAVRLALVEDGLGWKLARCWPLRPRAGARIYEVDGPAGWASLVARFPLEVTRSRRHDWWGATGWAGRWLIPNYQAVATEYDAVHVSVLGYLTTAGVAVPVPASSAGAPSAPSVGPTGGEASSGREAPSGSEAPSCGVAPAAGEARTLLAGWDPDATWWLTDVLAADGPPEDWAADEGGGAGWHLVGTR